jgi:hypothetical protein
MTSRVFRISHILLWLLVLVVFKSATLLASPLDTLHSRVTPVPSPPPLPFSGDYTWMNGQNRMPSPSIKLSDNIVMTGYFDGYFDYSFNHPKDHTLVSSTSMGRDQEFAINLAGIGFNATYGNVLGTLEFQFGQTLSIIQDGDLSAARGRNLDVSSLKYIREASAGYHFDKIGHGLNLEMGIFQSYVDLESYLLQENWNYQRSFMADNVPAYLTGIRAQYYPRLDLKTEVWLFNGWGTYGSMNDGVGIGVTNTYRPTDAIGAILNLYYAHDTRATPGRSRFNSDASVLVRYYNKPKSYNVSMMALSINAQYGFEAGGTDAVTFAKLPGIDSAYILAVAIADRIWFDHNRFALTMRLDMMVNPTRYVTVPPLPQGFISGYPDDPGYRETLWGFTSTFDIMPSDNLTFRLEFNSRHADIPFFAGAEGTTSPNGWKGTSGTYQPNLVKYENRLLMATQFRF